MTVTTLEAGQMAPEFRLKGPGGQWVSLSDYLGRQNVVLVFFPLAFSPTCSHQLPDVQKHADEFRALDAEVFGVSVDSHYSNEAFARALHLEFPLLSDFKRQAMTAYGVLNADAGYSGRALFLIDKKGRIAYMEVSANPGDVTQIPSNERLLEALRALPR
jgi:peroxiredoxin (alkyl hydroperoxide reductase subunit C)